MRTLIYCSIAFLFMGCQDQQEVSSVEKDLFKESMLDSLRERSDSTYSRYIGAPEFHSAEQLLSRRDSTITKIMRDSMGNVVAVVQFRNNIRTLFKEYYSNGQLKASLPLNAEGEFHGPSKYYHVDGRVKSEGVYVNGLFNSSWKNYDVSGKLISTDIYDENGQLVQSLIH
jgi:hypothetical protein